MISGMKRHFSTCRVCGQSEGADNMLKYGVRHYCHPECGLKKFGSAFFDRLTDWQLRQFPYMAAVRCGLKKELAAKVETLPPVDTTPIKY